MPDSGGPNAFAMVDWVVAIANNQALSNQHIG